MDNEEIFANTSVAMIALKLNTKRNLIHFLCKKNMINGNTTLPNTNKAFKTSSPKMIQ